MQQQPQLQAAAESQSPAKPLHSKQQQCYPFTLVLMQQQPQQQQPQVLPCRQR
jgi:hypothetical protein